MHIHTIEEDYEYRIKKLVKKFKQDHEIDVSGEKLADLLWEGKYALDFGRAVIDDICEFGGDEMFE